MPRSEFDSYSPAGIVCSSILQSFSVGQMRRLFNVAVNERNVEQVDRDERWFEIVDINRRRRHSF